MWKIAAIGECMLELSNPGGQPLQRNMPLQFSYGGDTLNTAVYLTRQGVACAYVTGLGDDPYSDWLLKEWAAENIDTSLVERFAGRNPGLYMIQTDDQGERSFHYWRQQAPARDLFSDETRAERVFAGLQKVDLVYLSGITLSLYNESDFARLLAGLQAYKAAGGRIAFDGNYRPRGWRDASAAQQAFSTLCGLATIVLPTFDDEAMLFGDTTPEATAARLHSYGVEEVAVKEGAKGVYVSSPSQTEWVSTTPVDKVIDSTAAGDSFNAGYLGARASGASPVIAAAAGNRLAGQVIQHAGAIIPESAMPNLKFEESL